MFLKCLLIIGLVLFCLFFFLCFMLELSKSKYISAVQQSILQIFFFRSECLVVKSYLCVAVTEAAADAIVKTNGKFFFLCYCPSPSEVMTELTYWHF